MPRDVNPFESEELLTDDHLGCRSQASAPRGVGRHFLFICGPFGPFTPALGESLRGAEARCTRVILNGGDLHDWGARHTLTYLGSHAGFGDWFSRTATQEGVTDIVIYSDAHPYCAEAARQARGLGLNVHVLEQGYFRPFWITLERGGVNGNTRLPRDPDVYRREAEEIPEPSEIWLPPLTPPAALKIFLYHAALILAAPAFPRFRAPYQYPILRQGLGHVRRYLHHKLFARRHHRALAKTLTDDGPLFLAILQRPGDSQLRLHSPFKTTAQFIQKVVASFARHAPANGRLLFKSHPLDHGLEPHAQAIAGAARASGVSDRVFFTDTGDLHKIMPAAAGAVTVNSTAGLAAIEHGLATVVMGAAIYDMPGLTHQGGLDTLWTAPEAPDADLFRAFRKVVIQRTQVSGAYATRQGVDIAVPEVARRLLAARPERLTPVR